MFIIVLQNKQLKDFSYLKKQIDNLQIEKNESKKIIEKLKYEKSDIEVRIEEQNNMFEKRENELLAKIQVNTFRK